jgi:hypothetical protein
MRDEQAQQIGRVAVVQCGARLVDERQCGEPRDPVIGRHVGIDRPAQCLRVGFPYRPCVEVPVGQTRSVCQQISKGDLSRCWICLIELTRRRAQDTHPGKFRRPTSDRFVQRIAPLLKQHEGCGGGDGFRHRSDTKQGAAFNRQLGLHVAPADRRRLDHLTVAPDQRRYTRKLTGFNERRHGGRDRVFTTHTYYSLSQSKTQYNLPIK